jgi:cytochrome b6-f complex iron-sulfur subunit
VERREFLKGFIRWTSGAVGLSVLTSSIIYLYPSEEKKMETKYFPVTEFEEAPQRGVKRINLTYMDEGRENETRIFLAALSEGLTAFSAVCSHLGCIVDWESRQEQFLCPCHCGKYDINGNVIGGPPPAPLTRLPLETRDGKVFVGIKV